MNANWDIHSKLPNFQKYYAMTVTMQLEYLRGRSMYWYTFEMFRLYCSLAACQLQSVATSVGSMICLACHPSSTFAISVCSLLGFSFTFMCFLPFPKAESAPNYGGCSQTTDSARKNWYSAWVLKMPNSAQNNAGVPASK